MPEADPKTRLVLASASPRRRELLGCLGVPFEVMAPDIDEAPRPAEPPQEYVLRVAREKAEVVASRVGPALVLGADTAVVLGDEILGKPEDPSHAAAMLRRLAARTHRVLSAVWLHGPKPAGRVVETKVCFRALSEEEIAWYVSTGEPMDKAGAYALQGKGGALVRAIEGSASNVVGLPLAEAIELLTEASFDLPWSGR
ncbi:MAG: septum formation inhibitor Maf [Myxococcales bacterium]|nr:septum formation inhibitor Maf [Myxococcales bacterium]